MKADFDAAELKMKHRRNALDALDHAGGNGGEEQFRRIESIRAAVDVGVENDLSVLAPGRATSGIDACSLQHRIRALRTSPRIASA